MALEWQWKRVLEWKSGEGLALKGAGWERLNMESVYPLIEPWVAWLEGG